MGVTDDTEWALIAHMKNTKLCYYAPTKGYPELIPKNIKDLSKERGAVKLCKTESWEVLSVAACISCCNMNYFTWLIPAHGYICCVKMVRTLSFQQIWYLLDALVLTLQNWVITLGFSTVFY